MKSNRVFQDLDGFDEFAKYVGLAEAEKSLRRATLARSYMPFRATLHYADLIRRAPSPDRAALLNIVTPPDGAAKFEGRFDPYGNISHSLDDATFLQHKYPRTLLFHITDFCVGNCQFCYKVNEIRLDHSSDAGTERKLSAAISYLSDHREIDNVLLTGGDPAAVRPNVLIRAIGSFLDVPHIRAVRFATKVVAYEPTTLGDARLIDFFSAMNARPGKQVSVIAQINHPAELDEEALATIGRLRGAGVVVRGQPAIIAGVNDDVDVLVRLYRSFFDAGIMPYYFTLFMPVRGVEQYAISVVDGYRLHARAVAQLGGLEKRGTLLLSHNFGKVELVGLLPNADRPRQAVLRWHEVVPADSLPEPLRARIACSMGDTFVLDLPEHEVYNLDQLFQANGLPYFDTDQNLIVGGHDGP